MHLIGRQDRILLAGLAVYFFYRPGKRQEAKTRPATPRRSGRW